MIRLRDYDVSGLKGFVASWRFASFASAIKSRVGRLERRASHKKPEQRSEDIDRKI